MRLKGKAKAGYYPTPPRVLDLVLEGLVARPFAEALDPCAGEGDVLRALAGRLRVRVQGIELSRDRARAARKKGLSVRQGDAFTFTGEGFSLLWLNPPYDQGEGERLEVAFLRHWTPALVPEGVLVYIIPEATLEKAAPFLTGHYEVEAVLRFPRPEYQAFRQVVVVARKRPLPVPPEGLEVMGTLGEYPFRVVVPGGEGSLRRTGGPTPEEILKALEASPLWAQEEGPFRPLLPLKDAHLALMLAGGLLDGQVVWLEDRPYAVMGQVEKVETVHEEEEGGRLRRITREAFRVRVVALDLWEGELLEVE